MDYEKKYKEAEKLYQTANADQRYVLESLFPKLCESEDEKIRKRIIALVNAHGQGMYKDDMLAWLEKQGEQKQDVSLQINPSEYINDMGGNGCYLKNATQVSAWSEEDEKMCQETIDWFEKKCFPYALENDNPARESIKWLKSLKDRYTWKPSDEQMVVLELACKYERAFTPKQIDILIGLKEQLKKLKGH